MCKYYKKEQSPLLLRCLVVAGGPPQPRALLLDVYSIKLLAKSIEKLICKGNNTKLTVHSCVPSLSDTSRAVAVGLQHPQPHSSIRFAAIKAMSAPTLTCGDGAVSG
jgi:hypothetical protein